jgi:hypothetical protein
VEHFQVAIGAYVTVEGIIHGSEPIQVPPELADKVKHLFGDSLPMRGYGHMNSYKMQINIENVLEAKEMDDDFFSKMEKNYQKSDHDK